LVVMANLQAVVAKVQVTVAKVQVINGDVADD
jgi:hypothetical protein